MQKTVPPAPALHSKTGFIVSTIHGLERLIAVVVVLLLSGVALLLLWDILLDVWRGFVSSDNDYRLTEALSQALLALMIAEIIGTVGSFLKQGIFDPVPFLVVGIIASIRRQLVISAEAAELFSHDGTIPLALLGELTILTLSIGILAWAIYILRRQPPATVSP